MGDPYRTAGDRATDVDGYDGGPDIRRTSTWEIGCLSLKWEQKSNQVEIWLKDSEGQGAEYTIHVAHAREFLGVLAQAIDEATPVQSASEEKP